MSTLSFLFSVILVEYHVAKSDLLSVILSILIHYLGIVITPLEVT